MLPLRKGFYKNILFCCRFYMLQNPYVIMKKKLLSIV